MIFIELICIAVAFYLLVVKGFMWPILCIILCYFAGKQLENSFAWARVSVGNILHHNISLGMVSAMVIITMTIGFFLSAKED